MSEEKANEIRVFKGKVNNNVFYFCENITEFGWVKTKKILPVPQDKILKQEEWIDKVQFPEGSGS